ncbi:MULTISPECIES: ABC transporter substrate-binding protein [Vibrio]|uniref:ABC transporter substrate-binding protein n=1 Tax=Vibrio natriegens NBRC 15636 = ATCC 14048 = DSM 759 TaxID=1219067 RepID=A0AAN1CW16_VIBNA|nr:MULTISPECIES: ABC transporter substrate-binding protein [Vibrio]MEE3879794.1 ABC transporter substrate-binding protein [Vibrio sp. YYF0003]AEX22643.1 ABC transporter substrate-binding protein [Vibrio sp. EJY3]ALR15067.1 ABC transporter substrate-binding protein [Vibrio natriegens NBRC 15636 = ATCC 14048 = DSM 759]ANQ13069.1 ABC transporter substrate-binding protein [Vibrio natriegens NBRC 15636 = ATCC 14048 = DSM 759]ANQ17515.1 ABC transporter substrate-binding protein [Vibrio natriegens]
MITKRLLATAILSATAVLSSAGAIANTATVAVSQIVEHPALDAARQGLLDGLKAKGYEQGKNLEFDYKTAQGNPAIAVQIARQFVGESPDVLVGIATPSAQALVSATRSIPVVFTAVTDPVGAKLVKTMEQPGQNVTGLSDLSPVAQHVELIQEILPQVKSIGVVFNPGEANAVTLVELLKVSAAAKGIEVVEATALKSADVQSATQAISAKSDIIYAPTDNTVASAIEGMIVAANQSKTPVFGGATSYVEKGAIAGLGFDYYQVGVQTADYVAAILDGQEPGKLDVKVATGSDLVINQDAASKLGIQIPSSVVERATSMQ